MSPNNQVGDYVIPIEGLSISRSFSVGPVRFFKSAMDLSFASEVDWAATIESPFVSNSLIENAVACVAAKSPAESFDFVGQALDVLRIFQYGIVRSAHYTHFGLPGEIRSRRIFYLRHNEFGNGFGFSSLGLHRGFELSEDGINSWEGAADQLRFAASAIGNPSASEGSKRALSGIRYFSKSILTDDPDLRILLIMASIEAMLSSGSKSPPRFTLSRYLAYLSCWKSGTCGEGSRPPCPYLQLDPSRGDIGLLQKLEKLALNHSGLMCSRWQIVNSWYDTRSGFVHGNAHDTDPDEARNFAYWAYMQYLSPVLDWLFNHPDEPARALREELNGFDYGNVDIRAIIASGDAEALIAACQH